VSALPKIDPQDLQDFRHTFAPDTSPRFGIKAYGADKWRTPYPREGGLTDERILAHLSGPDSYASSARDRFKNPRLLTTILTIDLDKGKKGELSPLSGRYDRVISAFAPATPMVFSTPSGGLHVVYPLAGETRRDWAIAFAVKRLQSEDLIIGSGNVEILEAGSLKRLPLGVGCYRLDPHTLLPIGSDNIEGFYSTLETITDPHYKPLLIGPQSLAEHPSKSKPSKARREPTESLMGLSEADRQYRLEHGLQEGGTRYGMMLTVKRHFGEQGKVGRELRDAMLEWMETHHNGMSHDWLYDRGMCIGNIEHLVITHKPSARPLPDSPPWEVWINELKLPRPAQRAVLRGMCERAYQYGEVSECGQWVDVDIPKQSLRHFHRQYSVALPALHKWGHVSVVRGYERPIWRGDVKYNGKCKRYRLPIVSQEGKVP
jgi:hypothetical protein